MYCAFCGEKLKEIYVYCPHCGKEVINNDSQQNDSSATENKLIPISTIENDDGESIGGSSSKTGWKRKFELKKINKSTFFFCCIIIFYIGTYLSIIPNTPDILALLLIIVLLALNFYLISAYGHSLKTLSQMLSTAFSTTFLATYVNYDYTADEYIDEMMGVDGIIDDTLFFATFVTVLCTICYYGMLKLHRAADEVEE